MTVTAAAMGRLEDITVKVIVHEHGTANGSYSHGPLGDLVMIEGFRHQPVSHSVAAAGTVVHDSVVEGSRFGKNGFHKNST